MPKALGGSILSKQRSLRKAPDSDQRKVRVPSPLVFLADLY